MLSIEFQETGILSVYGCLGSSGRGFQFFCHLGLIGTVHKKRQIQTKSQSMWAIQSGNYFTNSLTILILNGHVLESRLVKQNSARSGL